jgi:hypothetical protein
MGEYFLIYLLNLPVIPAVANSYLSHVSRFLLDGQYIFFPHELRSNRATQILRGAKKESDARVPARLRVKIPLTYPLACSACDVAAKSHSGADLLCVQAGIMLGFGLSTRPQELLSVSSSVPLTHQANSSLCFFWFDNCPFNVCHPTLYPKGRLPDGFSLLLDYNKNHQQGAGGPRAVWRSTHMVGRCCVLTAFAFLSIYPPLPDMPLLSSLGYHLSAATILAIFRATAILHKLDPKRLLPHSMRFGVICQLDSAGFDDATKMRQGDWSTTQGMQVYCHAAVNHAKRIAATVHDATLLPIHYSQHTYATALPGATQSRHVTLASLDAPRPRAALAPSAKRTRLR